MKHRKNMYFIMLVLLSGLNVNYKILLGDNQIVGLLTNYFIYAVRGYISIIAVYLLVKKKKFIINLKFMAYFVLIFIFNSFSELLGYGGGTLEWLHRSFSMAYLFLYYTYIIYVSEHNRDDLLKAMYYVTAFLMLDSLFLFYTNPSIASYIQSLNVYTLQGVAGSRNQIIEYWIMGTIGLFASEEIRKKKINWIIWMVEIYIQYLTQSATGIVVMVCVIVLGIILKKNKQVFRISMTIGYTAILFIYVYVVFQQKLIFRDLIVNILHKSPTLTGRFVVWAKSIPAISDSILFGYGYDSSDYLLTKYHIGLPDNAIIYLLLSSGIIGLALWIIFFVDSIKGLFLKKELGLCHGIFQIGVFAYIVRGISEAVLSYPHIVFWTMLILLRTDTNQQNIEWRKDEKNSCDRDDNISRWNGEIYY